MRQSGADLDAPCPIVVCHLSWVKQPVNQSQLTIIWMDQSEALTTLGLLIVLQEETHDKQILTSGAVNYTM